MSENQNGKPKQKKRSRRLYALIAFLLILLIIPLLSILHSKIEAKLDEQWQQKTQDNTETQQNQPSPDIEEEAGHRPEEEPKANGIETDTIISEDTENIPNSVNGRHFINSKELSIVFESGGRLKIGRKCAETDGLILDLEFTEANAASADEPYGFILRERSGNLQYSAEPGDISADQNVGQSQFVISGRFYNELIPVRYRSRELFGVKWSSGYEDVDPKITDKELFIHVVRIQDGALMGAARVEISYDGETGNFELASIEASDLTASGAISRERRAELIEIAAEFMARGNRKFGGIQLSKDDLARDDLFHVVENPHKAFFGKLYDAEGNVIVSTRFLRSDVIAVNLRARDFGYLTVYFASKSATLDNVCTYTSEAHSSDELMIIGYDAINSAPFDAERFADFVSPEDQRSFGLR